MNQMLRKSRARELAKKRSPSQNARKHGILVREIDALPEFDKDEFHRVTEELLLEYRPTAASEEIRIRELASLAWRIRRCGEAEAEILAMSIQSSGRELGDALSVGAAFRQSMRSLQSISEIEHRLSLRFARIREELKHLKPRRAAENVNVEEMLDVA